MDIPKELNVIDCEGYSMGYDDILNELKDKVIRIEVLLENNTMVQSLMMKTLEARMKKLEESYEWIWKVVITGFVTGLFGVFFSIFNK